MITTADDSAHQTSVALMKFLSGVAQKLGVAKHVYVVGGAVRNFVLGQPVKDIDAVVDSVALGGKNSEWFAKEVAKAIPVRTTTAENNYGVFIVTISEPWELDGYEMKGQNIDIANARKESYSKGEGGEGKGYKPDKVEPATILEDLERREFTFNTLLWRLEDLTHGPEHAEILDMLGTGKADLDSRTMRTPVDPDQTFGDDPTRILRAVKFIVKYGFKLPPDVAASIRRNAEGLKRMPPNAVQVILVEGLLEGPNPRRAMQLLHDLGVNETIKDILRDKTEFRTAIVNVLRGKETLLFFDLIDLGWVLKLPIDFLSRPDQLRLKEILLEHAGDGSFDKKFWAALTTPPIDQGRLIALFGIPKNDRGWMKQRAQQMLLNDPDLALQPRRLEQAIEDELRKKYPNAPLSPEKVAARFLGR